jgi:hypothetical protein
VVLTAGEAATLIYERLKFLRKAGHQAR